MTTKKKVGIIGGVGPQSTNYIYEKIIQFSQSKYNAKKNVDYPRLAIESVPVPDFISDKNNIEEAKEMLINATVSLTNSGATKLCIGSNTIHILLEELKKHTEVPFLSMIELVTNKCVKSGFKKVGILGTPVLVNSGLYTKELKKNGIETINPTNEQMKVIENIIRDVISGSENVVHKSSYIEVLNDLFSKGCEAIILGCTELPLAVDYEAFENRTISSDEVLAEGIVDYYYTNTEEK